MDPAVARDGSGGIVRRKVAVVGASAGGVEALTILARSLPADIPLAIAVVLHMPSTSDSRLHEVLERAGPLPAVFAAHGGYPEPGTIHIAPPDRHLVFAGERLFLLDGPRENGFRPSVDALFRSAARELGPRAVGVILSGTMDDGAAGLAAIRSFGGATIVQDPDDALAGGMPRAAIDAAHPDHVVSVAAIGELLAELAREEVPARAGVPARAEVPSHADWLEPRVRAARGAGSSARATAGTARPGAAGRSRPPNDPTLVADPMQLPPHGVDLACPECGGALQEVLAGALPRFRCRTGHVYSPGTLLDSKALELEGALWAAVRALEEEAAIAGRLVAKSRDAGATAAAKRFEERQDDAAARARLVRQALDQIGNQAGAAEQPTEPLTIGERGAQV